MPEVSRFYGIVVKVFHNEHPPPHFHVESIENIEEYVAKGRDVFAYG